MSVGFRGPQKRATITIILASLLTLDTRRCDLADGEKTGRGRDRDRPPRLRGGTADGHHRPGQARRASFSDQNSLKYIE